SELAEQFQRFKGFRTLAHHVAHRKEAIVAGHEPEAEQQFRQFVGAAVDVAHDEASRLLHSVSFTSTLRCEANRARSGNGWYSPSAPAPSSRPRSSRGCRTKTRRPCPA